MDNNSWFLVMMFLLIFQIKRLENLVDEQSKQRKSDNSQLPQVNGPEMQLYEIQSEFTNVRTNLGSLKVFIIRVITDFDPVINNSDCHYGDKAWGRRTLL